MAASRQESEIKIIYIDSLSDFIRQMKKFENPQEKDKRKPDPLWFRGNPDFNFGLLPRLYRTVNKHLKEQNLPLSSFWFHLKEEGEYYLKNFKIRNYHLLQRLPENSLAWMTIMQHYDLPTRLLDWSEHVFAALFFALNDEFSQNREHEGCAPCIWCLKPLELNRFTKSHYRLNMDTNSLPDMFSLMEFSLQSTEKKKNQNLLKYFFHPQFQTMNKCCNPLAIHAPYNNERIRAQSGAFTLFPLNTPKTIEKFEYLGMENLPEAGNFLRLFILRKPFEISYELKAMGVKRSQFFPEMPSISYDIEQELYKTF